MSVFSSYKKIFLLGFIAVILLAIPFSVYIAQKRQQTKTQAAKSTILSFEPGSPTVKVGETLTLNVMLDPGTGSSANQVSIVKLSITFDQEKFTTAGASLEPNPVSPNTLTTTLEGPTFEAGKASIFLSIGADPAKAVVTKTKIAVLKLKAIGTTTSTIISFDENNEVLSIASSDQTSENVLSTRIPATVTISNPTTESAPTLLNPTTAPGQPSSPTGTSTSQSSGSSLFGNSTSGNDINTTSAPTCSNLSINGPTTGTAPYTLTFTAIGNDSDGTINKISFNFGDSIEDLLSGGGIGTSSVNSQISHTYNTSGIYTAYAILTDNSGNLSIQQDNCTKTITIDSNLGANPQESNPTTIVQEPLPPTGDNNTMLGLGMLGALFTVIGAAFFILF